tara:strand:- start:545 stop:835 length:291 start_codon:yes stop_codon:yes gene_type:complete
MPSNKKISEKQKATNMYWKIKNKWAKETELTNGWFLQHIDGNTLNNNINNLKKIHPKEVFTRLSNGENLVVDWVCGLTEKEIDFVKLNADVFAGGY